MGQDLSFFKETALAPVVRDQPGEGQLELRSAGVRAEWRARWNLTPPRALILCRKGIPVLAVVQGLLWLRLGGLIQIDHDLAKRVTGLHCSQSLWRFVKGVGLEHLGIDLARGDQVGDGGNAPRAG